MRTNAIFLISTICLICGNIYILISYSTLKGEFSKNEMYMNYLQKDYDAQNELMLSYYRTQVSNKDRSEFLTKYPELAYSISSGKKVVLYFEEDVCASCLLNIFIDLQFLGEKIGMDNIIVITTWGKDGKPMKYSDYSFDYFLVETLSIPLENYKLPYLFVVDELFNVNLTFIPEIQPGLNDKYFDSILVDYFSVGF